MIIQLTPYVLDDFYKITRCDVRGFLVDYTIFNQTDYNNIFSFYTGKTKTIDPQAFVNFKDLKSRLKEVLIKFQQFNRQLENIKYVELLEVVEECNDVLRTLNNIARWARVSVDDFGYNPTFKIKYVLSQYDTLEKIASFVVQSTNPQDDWWSVAIENNLSEDDYSSYGGKVLDVTKNSRDVENFNITSVLDIIEGKSIQGRDIDRNIHFGSNDLAYLDEDDTITQAVNILATLRKRDNLDFLSHGLQTSLIVGQSRNLFNFPVIERQMKETFKNDDTLKNFTLTGYRFDQDNVFIEFTVQTRLGEVRQLELNI